MSFSDVESSFQSYTGHLLSCEVLFPDVDTVGEVIKGVYRKILLQDVPLNLGIRILNCPNKSIELSPYFGKRQKEMIGPFRKLRALNRDQCIKIFNLRVVHLTNNIDVIPQAFEEKEVKISMEQYEKGMDLQEVSQKIEEELQHFSLMNSEGNESDEEVSESEGVTPSTSLLIPPPPHPSLNSVPEIPNLLEPVRREVTSTKIKIVLLCVCAGAISLIFTAYFLNHK